MQSAVAIFRKVLLWLAIVGAVAAIVYGFCCLIVREIGHRVPMKPPGTHMSTRCIPNGEERSAST